MRVAAEKDKDTVQVPYRREKLIGFLLWTRSLIRTVRKCCEHSTTENMVQKEAQFGRIPIFGACPKPGPKGRG